MLFYSHPNNMLDLKPCGIPSVIGLGILVKIREEKQPQNEHPSWEGKSEVVCEGAREAVSTVGCRYSPSAFPQVA